MPNAAQSALHPWLSRSGWCGLITTRSALEAQYGSAQGADRSSVTDMIIASHLRFAKDQCATNRIPTVVVGGALSRDFRFAKAPLASKFALSSAILPRKEPGLRHPWLRRSLGAMHALRLPTHPGEFVIFSDLAWLFDIAINVSPHPSTTEFQRHRRTGPATRLTRGT